MIKHIDLLMNTDFFKGIPKDMIINIIQSEVAYIKKFDAGAIIYETNQPISYAGIVLTGMVDVIHLSVSGHETIVKRLSSGTILGASFSLVDDINTLNTFRSVTDCEILFLNLRDLVQKKHLTEEYRLCLFDNIIMLFAKNNIISNAKIQILTQKSLREKILAYFEFLAIQSKSDEFLLPFNREQLASYLGSERSSVCRELSKLSKEGLISVNKNRIKLLYSL